MVNANWTRSSAAEPQRVLVPQLVRVQAQHPALALHVKVRAFGDLLAAVLAGR